MESFRRISSLPKLVVSHLENSKAPFHYFIITFLSVIALRIFLEIFSDRDGAKITTEIFLHLYSAFIALALLILLLFYLATKENIIKIAKVILPSFIIILLPPILDLILSKGKGYNMAYMLPGTHDNIVLRYFTFFGDFPGIGVTLGMKIEIAVILIFSFIYFYLKTQNTVKSLINTFLFYTLIFWLAISPFFLKLALELLGLNYQYSELLLFNYFLVLIFLASIPLAYLSNKTYFKLIIKDTKPFRLAHFELMFALGIIFGLSKNTFSLNEINIFYFIFIPISILAAIIFTAIINNIEDYNIDKISNKDRPLIRSNITIEEYRELSWPFLFIAIFYAAVVSFEAFFLISLCIGNAFLHSAKPLRLKILPILPKLIISLNSLVLVLLGFAITTGSIQNFPKIITAIILIGFTLVINFRDIKDYHGDKKAGIKTLPVVLGLKKAKILIGVFFILTYLSIFFIVKEKFAIPILLLLGCLQFYLINKRKYSEIPVYLVFFISLAIFAAYIMLKGIIP